MPWPGWENYAPPAPAKKAEKKIPSVPPPFENEVPPSTLFESELPPPAPAKLDRGRRMGAQWVYVTKDGLMVPYVKGQKPHGADLFKSKKEARYYVYLLSEQKRNAIRGLQRQVRFALMTRTKQGLMAVVCHYVADFTYTVVADESFHVVDVKPRGGANPLREDTYKLKKKWFELQEGLALEEA